MPSRFPILDQGTQMMPDRPLPATPLHGNMGRNSDDSRSITRVWWQWLIVAFIIYILPFIAIAIDEGALKTFWFSSHLPHEAGDLVRSLYPFYKFFNW